MKSSATSKVKKPFTPGKGKTWSEKINNDKDPEVKRNDKGFADIPPGSIMLIATPKIIDDYVNQIPKGKSVTLQTMRKDLAEEYNAEFTCPVTTGIFLRIVGEAALEKINKRSAIKDVTPFWRVVDENSTIGKKLSCGPEFVKRQRKKEGIESQSKKK